MSNTVPYVLYWELTQRQYESFCGYFYGAYPPPDSSPFEKIGDSWFAIQDGHADIGEALLEWDEEDGPGGEQTYYADRWSISQVPSVLWP